VTKRLKRDWDTYVRDAGREPVELELPDGDVITIQHPPKKKIDWITKKARASDDDFAIALMGEEQANKLLALAADKPAGVIQRLLGDVMVEFGLWTRNPFEPDADESVLDEEIANLDGSSNSSTATARR
jgi:hypothetical protein